MSRSVAAAKAALLILLPSLAWAAIWPDQLGEFHRASAQAAAPAADRAIWEEYGFRQGETAKYEGASAKFSATAWQFQDSTGAMAAFEWLRSTDSKPGAIARLSAETDSGTLLVHGNYALLFEGFHPTSALLTPLIQGLKQVDSSPLPALMDYLPTESLVPNSERYIEGPAGLQKFDPGIPPSAAAFHLSAEAQLGLFHGTGGDMRLAIFNYPTPQIAMLQTMEFQKIGGAMVKRSGPMVAVILAPPNADAAERLLSLVRYKADITLDERVSTRRDNIGNLVINAFILIGILLCFSLVGGLAFGGVRAFLRRGPRGQEADAMIVLHLSDR
ncbi:MAG TPA: DUF6599 family protein [Bryobacteraceae bacterium]|nr:DUF6599 family protein [Bryobacteraceae bacterium]